MNFEIYWGTPETFFWDTVTDWFYVGGDIYIVDGKKVNRMFRIDSLGKVDYMDTINGNMHAPLSIVKYKDTIYHTGISGMYTYKNSKWKSLFKDSTKKDPILYCSYVYKGELLLGGRFKNATNGGNDGLAIRYDGNEFYPFQDIWELLGGKYGNAVADISDITEYKGKLYIGGGFGLDSGDIYHSIISWDGVEWGDVGGGIFPPTGWEGVNALMVYKDELYVAGLFHTATGSMSNNILKWDGEQWYAIGNGIYGYQVYGMMVFQDELWVFGNIDSVDYLGLSKIAIWNGEYWCSPGGNIDLEISVAAEYRDTLYIGGNFRHIDFDSTLKHMVKYNEDAPRKCGPPVDVRPLGINQPQVIEHLDIYPNPTTGIFTVDMGRASWPVQVVVYNALGLRVHQEKIVNKGLINIQLPGSLGSGIYFIQILGKNEGISQKILLRKD